jgi:PAS domain S-box-containing protein
MGAAAKVWSETVDRARVPVLLVGRGQTVTYANEAAHEFLGYRPSSLAGVSLKWLSPPSLHEQLAYVDAVFAGGDARRVRSVALGASGGRMDVTLVLEPCLDSQGEVAAVSVRYEPVQRHSTRPPPAPKSGTRSTAPVSTMNKAREIESHEAERGVSDRLDSAVQLLRWLAERLTSPNAEGQEDARERARMLMVVSDVNELLLECQRDMQRGEPATSFVREKLG